MYNVMYIILIKLQVISIKTITCIRPFFLHFTVTLLKLYCMSKPFNFNMCHNGGYGQFCTCTVYFVRPLAGDAFNSSLHMRHWIHVKRYNVQSTMYNGYKQISEIGIWFHCEV